MRASDAASLLKQFLRELPVPLLSNEYLDAFSQIESRSCFIQLTCSVNFYISELSTLYLNFTEIKDPEEQKRAVNLLVLLLPDVNRDSLLVS